MKTLSSGCQCCIWGRSGYLTRRTGGEEWPLILRKAILAAEEEFFDVIWYDRKLGLLANIAEGKENAITSKGHMVVTATNGIEGMQKFSAGKFDLVITDIIMPDKEGIELIMEMKRHTPGVKILAISGGGRTGNVEFLKMATKLGAVASLKKPIRLAEFYKVLSQCLGEPLSS